MASTDSLPIPRKNVAYRATFPILKNDGTLITGATGLDSEVSKDGGTFADCSSEATEIATSSGIYYLDLTSTEMNADTVAIIVKSSSTGALTQVLVLYPQEAGDIRTNPTYWNDAAVATPDTAGYPKVTVKSGTGTGEINLSSGVTDANIAKVNGAAIATPAVAGYLPVDTTKWLGGTIPAVNVTGVPKVDLVDWLGVAPLALTAQRVETLVGSLASGVITAASIASDAITAAKIATDAIGSAQLAATAVTEIQTGLATSANQTIINNNVVAAIAAIATLNNLSAAQVNAEVVDALSVDTYGEPSSVPVATASLAAKLGWLAIVARNKRTQSTTTQTVFADDGTTPVATSAVSDSSSLLTVAEWS